MSSWLRILGLICCLLGSLPSNAQVDSMRSKPDAVFSTEESDTPDIESTYLTSPLEAVIIRTHWGPQNSVTGAHYWISDSLTQANGKMGSVADILRAMPSLSLKRYAPGGLSSPTMRGTGAGHTQIYWEGLPLNSPMLGQQDFALSGGGLFNHVEARYGGNSLVQGSGGLGGAILLGSAPQVQYFKPALISYSQQVSSFGNLSSNLGLQFAGKRFSSSTKLYWNSGRNDFPFVNTGQAGEPVQRLENAAIRQLGGMQEIQGFVKRNDFNLKVWTFASERELPPTMLLGNTRESQSDRAVRAMLRWRKYIPQAYIQTNVAYFRESLTYRNPTAGILAPSSFDRFIAESQYVRHSGGEPAFKFQNAGLRYVHDQARSDGFTLAAQQNLWSTFAHGELTLGKKKTSKIGLVLREELYNQRLSPLLGLLGCSFGNKTRLSGSISRNYRYPTLNDRFWVPGGNPDLRPEQSLSGEFSILRWLPWTENGILEYSLGGYWNEVDDWILWLPGNGNIWSPENVQHVQARGIEANFHWKGPFQNIYPWMYHDISVNYNFNDSRNQDGDLLIYTPRHNATFRLGLQWARWSLQYFQDWNSRRYTTADNSDFIPGFSTADLSVGCRLGKAVELQEYRSPTKEKVQMNPHLFKHFHLQAGVRNLWNARFQTVAWRPMPGRSYFLRLDVDLWKQRGGN